jgi:hypothetical protein
VEGTISQGVRAFGMRRSRYRGLDKTHLQHVAIAAAMNVDRLVAWFDGRPRAQTRTTRFAALRRCRKITFSILYIQWHSILLAISCSSSRHEIGLA